MASRKGSLIRGWRAVTSDIATKPDRMQNPTDAIKAVFAYEGDPVAIAGRIHQEMAARDGDSSMVGGRYCVTAGTGRRARKKVAIAYQRAIKIHPPRSYHKVPLWGIYVAPFFYTLYLDPAADMVARGGCATHVTMASHGIEMVGVVGETSLDHSDVFDMVRRVASAFGADDGPHTLYWNAVDFLKASAEALCMGSGGCAWEAVVLDEAVVRAGLFAAVPDARYDAKNARDVPADRRHRSGSAIACPRARSAAFIRAHWPDVMDPDRDSMQSLCLLA